MKVREEILNVEEAKFLDIKKIDGISYMYLRYNKETKRHEWLDYSDNGFNFIHSSTMQFILSNKLKIDEVFVDNGYSPCPLIEKNGGWDSEKNICRSLAMENDYSTDRNNEVRPIVPM